MRRVNIVLFFVLLGCNSSATSVAPEELIPAQKMENILFDLSLLKAIDNTKLTRDGEEVFNNQYLLRKYNIDSLTFAQNQHYYAQNPKLLFRIYQRIDRRLEQLLDSLRSNEKNETIPSQRQ